MYRVSSSDICDLLEKIDHFQEIMKFKFARHCKIWPEEVHVLVSVRHGLFEIN